MLVKIDTELLGDHARIVSLLAPFRSAELSILPFATITGKGCQRLLDHIALQLSTSDSCGEERG